MNLDEIRIAAEAGDPEAQYDLGSVYSIGSGVAEDKALGVAWFRKAALQGNVDAILRLARAYEKGEGVEQNKKTAKKWLDIVERGDCTPYYIEGLEPILE